ncbi:MAG TPA: S53 family peptidase [Anaerolineales bacterium]|nr:S53 family peptidase [Anaerolineales bacterium]
MNLKKAFSLLVTFALLAGALAVFPASAHAIAKPMIEKGPQAHPAKGTSTTSYGIFDCQDGEAPYVCYDPYQIRHAYRTDNLINAGFTGKGKTIVIIDSFQSPNIVAQLNYFDSYYGLASLNGLGGAFNPKLGTFTQVAPDGLTPFDQTNDDMVGWAMEISLDVEWAHAIAPGANIVLDLAKSDADADILSATQYAINKNLGDVISQSFGENESCVDTSILVAEHLLFAKAALKNMTLFASAGDDGAAQLNCAGTGYVKAASSPASDTLVTGVGGTTLNAAGYCLASLGCNPKKNPVPGTNLGEVVWNEADLGYGATGGGLSVLFGQPFFQAGAFQSKQRGVPDVAYNASVMDGVLVYLDIPGLDSGFWIFGGTSSGSPQWAAITAIADQKAGHDLGFINPALYQIAKDKKAYKADFLDITSGNNSVTLDVAITGYNAGAGWDATTGLGSPVADQLVNALIKTVSANDGKLGSQTSGPSGNHSGSGHFFNH